jgi:hypothetical protein
LSERKELDQVEVGVRFSSGAFTRNIFMHVSEIPKIRKKHKNTGVYVSAYRYENAEDKTNSLLIGDLYIDLDIDDLKDPSVAHMAFEKIRDDAIKVVSFFAAIFHIDESMIHIYYSGQKGIHIIVPYQILGITPMKELNHIFHLVANEAHRMTRYKTVDLRIYDNARLFSLPGGIHPETGRYKIPLTFDELRTLTFDKVKKLAQKPRHIEYTEPRYNTKANRVFRSYIESWEKEKEEKAKRENQRGDRKLNFCPPCIESILNRQCMPGSRNNTAAALTSYFRQRGYSKKKSWNKLQEWNNKYAGLPKRELERTFESIFNRDYVYGCSTLEQLGTCLKNECKIGRNR